MTDQENQEPPEGDIDPNLRYRIIIRWLDGGVEVIRETVSWKLENDVYFFFIESEKTDKYPVIRTLWIKHPELAHMVIEPFIIED